ncbi:MAG: hypothetical protein K2X93_02650 [Candidatus Obscuribacterales bacterium]|nr:hypothetical protein [Candidatus Obscuribacterales bacterium]
MHQTDDRVLRFLGESLSTVVQSVTSGRAISGKIRFTDPNGPMFNNFWWIEVSNYEGDKLFAATNDIDLMVSSGPSFWKTVPMSDGRDLVDAAVTFLSEKFATAQHLEILLQGTSPAGQPALPTCVGNSDDGFDNISEQAVYDVF